MSNSLYSFIEDVESQRNLTMIENENETLNFCLRVFLFTYISIIGVIMFVAIVYVCVAVVPDATRDEIKRLRSERRVSSIETRV